MPAGVFSSVGFLSTPEILSPCTVTFSTLPASNWLRKVGVADLGPFAAKQAGDPGADENERG